MRVRSLMIAASVSAAVLMAPMGLDAQGNANLPQEARLELLDVGAPDRVGTLLVEIRRIEATDVVRLERRRCEHQRAATDRCGRRRARVSVLVRARAAVAALRAAVRPFGTSGY